MQGEDDQRPRATDAETETETEAQPAAEAERDETTTAATDESAPVTGLDRLRGRIESRFGGRPLGAYAVLLAAALVLCVLMAIIFATRGNDSPTEVAPCYVQPDVQVAKAAVLNGQVERVRIILPKNRPDFGVAFMTIRMDEGSCFSLTQGQVGQDDAYLIIGAAEAYNRTTDQRRVEVAWEEQDVPDSVFFTPIPPPTTTPTVTPTPPPTITATAAAATPVPPVIPASPVASPVVVTVTAAPTIPAPASPDTPIG